MEEGIIEQGESSKYLQVCPCREHKKVNEPLCLHTLLEVVDIAGYFAWDCPETRQAKTSIWPIDMYLEKYKARLILAARALPNLAQQKPKSSSVVALYHARDTQGKEAWVRDMFEKIKNDKQRCKEIQKEMAKGHTILPREVFIAVQTSAVRPWIIIGQLFLIEKIFYSKIIILTVSFFANKKKNDQLCKIDSRDWNPFFFVLYQMRGCVKQ